MCPKAETYHFFRFCLVDKLGETYKRHSLSKRNQYPITNNKKLGLYWAKLSLNWNWNFVLLHSRFVA